MNPQRATLAEQDEILSQLKSAGVATMRVPLVDDSSVGFILRAHKLGIGTVAIVSLQTRDGAPVRPANPAFNLTWASAGLSALDTAKTKASLQPHLKALEDAGVQLRALEVGNEINWTPFNGDFVVPARGRILGIDDLRRAADSETKILTAGLVAYVRGLAVVKELRDGTRLNQHTPVLTAGLADCGLPGQLHGSQRDCIGISATIEYLQEKGADRYADGYGVHTYPGEAKQSIAARIASLEKDALARCTIAKPCWVTEWGLNNKATTCPLDDRARAELAASVHEAFKSFVDAKRVKGALYFSWSGQPHDKENQGGLFRCGAPTKTSAIVLRTFSR